MGIIRAAIAAVGGELADQWLETIEPHRMDNETLASHGEMVRKNDKRNRNRRGSQDVISNGSVIHVPENTYMILADGGKIIAATDQAGYYQVDNSRSPSLFFESSDNKTIEGYNNTGEGAIERPGGLENTLKDTWERFKFGGGTPAKQSVIYINKMEIPSIRFGTRNPVPYTDRVLVPGRVVPCKVTSFGTYSIKISDPLLFYREVCSKSSKTDFTKSELAEQYLNEFLEAYQTALASLSMDQVMVNDIPIQTKKLGSYMADALDKEWMLQRGFYIQSVGIAGINFDERTNELLAQYASDSILFDPTARAARMTGSVAEGIKSAGANQNGAMMGFAGLNMGMNASGGLSEMMNYQGKTQENTGASQSETVKKVDGGWTCSCGHINTPDAKFCSNCGSKKPQNEKKETSKEWICQKCGHTNEGKFCSNCGAPKPQTKKASYKCNKCGWEPEDPMNPPKFCPNCGDKFDMLDQQ